MARPFIRVPRVARFTVTMLLNGVPFSNCFHFHKEGGAWTDEDLIELNSAGLNTFRNSFYLLMGNDVTLKSIKSQSLESEDGSVFTATVLPTPGGYPSPALPLNVALYCRLHRRKRVHDKYHYLVLGGIPESVVTGNVVSEEYKELVRFAGGDFLDSPYLPVNWNWVYIKYIFGGDYLPFGQHFEVAFSHPEQVRVGTRARRARNKLIIP